MILLEALINTFWQSAILAAVTWALMRLLRVNAATRCVIWWAVLAVVVILPMTRLIRTQESAVPVAHLVANSVEAQPQFPTSVPDVSHAKLVLTPGDWIELLAALWVFILLAQFVRVLFGFLYLWNLKRRASTAASDQAQRFDYLLRCFGIRRRARLLISSRISSPVAVGFLRPAVILPSKLAGQLTPDELDHVLLHEIAHIARRDDWLQLAAAFAWSTLALHPVAAWVLRQIAREREIACDDWVVAATGEARPYARSLARLFELRTSQRGLLLASGIGGSGSNLGDRIALLLERGRAFRAGVSISRVGAMTLLLIAMLALASRTPAWVAFAQAKVSHPIAQKAPVPQKEVQVSRESFLAGLVAAGYGDLSVDDIINLKNQGVSAGYVAQISQAGWGKLEPSKIIELKQHGVDPDYAREIHELGFGPYTPGQMINLKEHGVPVDLVKALKNYGLTKIAPEELTEARDHGVTAQSVREARSYGNTLTLRQIQKLKQAGVI